MGQGDPPSGSFNCHPECLKRSYWRRVFLEVEEEIRGLRPGQFVELVLAVDEAESETWWPDRPASKIGKRAAVELFLRGWAELEIDRAFGFTHGATARVLAESRIHPKARDVVAAHLEGDPPSRISRDWNVGIPTVCDVLASIGEEPHRIRDLAKSEGINHSVIRLYKDLRRTGSKNIYEQISARLGISVQDVRNRVAYARRNGKITDPPLARSNVKRRRPRAAE